MIKAVIFDLDGVLIDTEYRAIKIKADLCRRYGLEWTADDYYRTAARPFATTIGRLFPDKTQEELNGMLAEYRSIAYVDMDYHRLAMPNAGELLKILHEQGYRIAIASMSPRRKINQVLSANHWENYVDLFVASDDVERLKPDPDSYLKAMNKLGMTSDECIVIEDSQVGIDAAHGAGCRCICRREHRYPIEQTGAEYYIDDLLDAAGIINEMRTEHKKNL